jgi:L-ascorbate metabolism protein UlaG (beta-lactamase superfamily)
MKVKKLGHCCFVVEINGKRIMTDPGSYSTLQNEETNIDLLIITHEHQDHLHIDSVKEIIKNNPTIAIITNTAVGTLLTEAGIPFTKVEEGESYDLDSVHISGFGNVHAEIYGDVGRVQNTGYMINELCYPGDSFSYPDAHIDILALPVAGPWLKMKEVIEYAKNIHPRICFPVHDAAIKEFAASTWRFPESLLKEDGIIFRKLEIGKEEEL